MKKLEYYKKAFTLIELLVVIAIISVLAGIVLTSTSSARNKSENSYTNQTVGEYIKAFTLYYHDHNFMDPIPTNLPVFNSMICLGTPCPGWGLWGVALADPGINAALSPYMSSFPNVNKSSLGSGSSTIRGLVYFCGNPIATCPVGALYWPLKGDAECAHGAQKSYSSFTGYTTCRLDPAVGGQLWSTP